MTHIDVHELRDRFQELIGHKCWRVFCGPSTGTILSIEFEPLVKRTLPLTTFNPTLSDDERALEGAYSLYIECDWHLQHGSMSLDASVILHGPEASDGAF